MGRALKDGVRGVSSIRFFGASDAERFSKRNTIKLKPECVFLHLAVCVLSVHLSASLFPCV